MEIFDRRGTVGTIGMTVDTVGLAIREIDLDHLRGVGSGETVTVGVWAHFGGLVVEFLRAMDVGCRSSEARMRYRRKMVGWRNINTSQKTFRVTCFYWKESPTNALLERP